MKKWKYEIDIKQHLIKDGSFKDFALAANKISEEFKKLPESLFDGDIIQDDLEYLSGCHESDNEVYETLEEYIYEINYRINYLYDFADDNCIWCG